MEATVKQKLVSEFIGKCRSEGLSVTPQRLLIYQALVDDTSHPSPEKVYQTLHADHPTISLATVYKTLETFQKHGLVSLVTTLHNTLRYDPKVKRHHHIVCVKCKKVIDLEDAELDALKIPKAVTRENNLIDYSVHFNVICAECREKK
ncbi:hypothetical protein B1H10_03545 [candidate division KSB1 bacterium 4484_188]|nr:MAG: hypothetical protein B1H10_03545 [candidate division KSB1 bacterium 4484_188]